MIPFGVFDKNCHLSKGGIGDDVMRYGLQQRGVFMLWTIKRDEHQQDKAKKDEATEVAPNLMIFTTE